MRWLAAGAAPAGQSAEDDESPMAGSRARSVLWGVSVVLALVMSVLRHCA